MAMYLNTTDLTGAVTTPVGTFSGQGIDFTVYPTPQLTNLIQQASDKIDRFCRDSHNLQYVTEYYRGNGTNFLRLRHYPIWAGLSTTLVGAVAKGATSIVLASAAGVLPGQHLIFGDGLDNPIAIDSSYVPPAQGASTANITVPLVSGTTTSAAHASGAAVSISGIDALQVVLPGLSVFPLPVNQFVVEANQGTIQNYTPLMFQQLGYSSIFPRDVPLQVSYTYGYPYPFPPALRQTCLELCISTVARTVALAHSGQSQQKIGSVQYTFNWQIPELTLDQKDALVPFRRGQGIW